MADYTQCWCERCGVVTIWRYADSETPNLDLVCTRCERNSSR